jgi:hypothetical protein
MAIGFRGGFESLNRDVLSLNYELWELKLLTSEFANFENIELNLQDRVKLKKSLVNRRRQAHWRLELNKTSIN